MVRLFLSAIVFFALPFLAAEGARAAQQQGPPPATDKSQSATEKAQSSNDTKAKKPAKKVWTNDNLEGLSSTSSVSVVGSASTSRGDASGRNTATASAQDKLVQRYHERLAPLRAEIERLDAEIKKMQDFRKDGSGSTGGVNLSQRRYSISPENNIQQYEKRKVELQKKIDDIEDQARRDGIPPGALR